MASLDTLSTIINIATGGAGAHEDLFFWKDSRVGGAAAVNLQVGFWTSLWLYNGQPAGAAAAPGAVTAPGRTTTGALMQADPSGGRQKWVLGLAGIGGNVGSLVLYDRLLHMSGLSGTSVAAQAVGGTLTRNMSGIGNQLWVEIYTQIGATGTTITASYTSENGAGRTSVARTIGGTGFREAQRLLQLPLQAGDQGVISVQTVTLAGTTGTVGDFGVTIVKPLAITALDEPGIGTIRSFISAVPGPPEIVSDAALAFMVQGAAAASFTLFGSLHSVER